MLKKGWNLTENQANGLLSFRNQWSEHRFCHANYCISSITLILFDAGFAGSPVINHVTKKVKKGARKDWKFYAGVGIIKIKQCIRGHLQDI